jgi:GNAT superfamily N-acetyltransferase
VSRWRRARRLLDLVEELVTVVAERDALELRRGELAAAWAERVSVLDPAAAVLVAPAPVRRLSQLAYAIVAHERRPPADLPDVDLDDWWDGFYELHLELYVAEPTSLTYERAGELSARPRSNAPGERRGLELGSVSVREGLRGGGLGARLVRELVARARFQAVDSITVAVSPGWSAPDAYERLVGFYRRLGFEAGRGRRMRLDLGHGRAGAGGDRRAG